MSTPRLSIVLPVYNGQATIAAALDALLGQSFTDFELLVGDNASTDDTPAILAGYAARDARVRVIPRERNLRFLGNFNRLIGEARGELFMLAAADDLWSPGYVEACVRGLDASPGAVLGTTHADCVYGERLLFVEEPPDTTGPNVGGPDGSGLDAARRFQAYKRMLHRPRHVGALFMGVMKKAAFDQVSPMPARIGSDQIMLCGLALLGGFAVHPETLMVKRFGGASKSVADQARAMGLSGIAAWAPFVVREWEIARLLFTSSSLRPTTKVRLVLWSAGMTVLYVWGRKLRKRIDPSWGAAKNALLTVRRRAGVLVKPWLVRLGLRDGE